MLPVYDNHLFLKSNNIASNAESLEIPEQIALPSAHSAKQNESSEKAEETREIKIEDEATDPGEFEILRLVLCHSNQSHL